MAGGAESRGVGSIDLLRSALEAGRTDDVRRILQGHPELRPRLNEAVFAFGGTALSAFAADPDLVSVLLDFGADPNLRSDWWAGGFHPLHSASAASGEILLARGATPDACAAAHLDRRDLLAAMLAEDPSRVHERGGDGQTPLHFARSAEVADMLLRAGADIDAIDVDHRSTAAEWMLERRKGEGRYDLARHLVERGASVDIFLAAALGLSERAHELLKSDSSLLDLRTGSGAYGEKPPSSYHIYFWSIGGELSPMEVALQFEQPGTLEVMKKFATPRQLLLFAAGSGDADAAREVLAANPGLIGSLAATDLAALPNAATNRNVSAVALMLEMGFDPTVLGRHGGSALHWAAFEGSTALTHVILRHARAAELLELRDSTYSGTPLQWCCHGFLHGPPGRDHAGVARLLVEAGARRSDGDSSPEVVAVLNEWLGGR